jgi:hypothetical protein
LALIEVGGDSGIVQLHTMSEKVYIAFHSLSLLHSLLVSIPTVTLSSRHLSQKEHSLDGSCLFQLHLPRTWQCWSQFALLLMHFLFLYPFINLFPPYVLSIESGPCH